MKSMILTAALAVLMAFPLTAQHADHGDRHTAEGELHDPALGAQLEAVRTATARYRDIQAARADGYVRFGDLEGPLMGEHWFRRDLTGEPLDLTRPSTLQYAVIDGRHVLVGVAYTVYRRPSDPMPEGFAGSHDHWHIHDVARIARAATADRPVLRWIVDRRADRGKLGRFGDRTELTMVHAWVWSDNPDGPFAESHRGLPYLRAGLPADWARGASEASAWGVALLAEDACDIEIRRVDFLARLGRDQRRDLEVACQAAADLVGRSRDSGDRERIKAMADRAWTGYLAEQRRVLTPEQQDRLNSLVDHPM